MATWSNGRDVAFMYVVMDYGVDAVAAPFGFEEMVLNLNTSRKEDKRRNSNHLADFGCKYRV